MPLIPFPKMLEDARAGGYAVAYFQAWNQESLEAILEAAEEEASPVILGFGGTVAEPEWFDRRGLEYFGALAEVAGKQSQVPVSLILNEVETPAQCARGIDLGFNVLMLDTSALSFQENLEATRKLVDMAHPKGVGVEAELGQLPEAGTHKEGSLTDPEQAVHFVKETGIDALAVSIGNVHGLTRGKAEIDFDRLQRINKATDAPLVIHGGTGFPDRAVERAISFGARKFNIGMILTQSYLHGLRKGMDQMKEAHTAQQAIGSRKKEDILFPAVTEVKNVVKRLVKLYGSAGKA